MKNRRCAWIGLWTAVAAYACGDDSAPAAQPSVEARVEAPGDNCEHGGVGLARGIDANGDGSIQGDEVTRVDYVCNGAGSSSGGGSTGGPGSSGTPQLVALMGLPSGHDDCPEGGVAIRTGVDEDGDGILDASEVESTELVCNASPVAPTVVRSDMLSAGDTHCPIGGVAISSGPDSNGNGTLDAAEVVDTAYACNGDAATPPDPAELCAFPAEWDAEASACVVRGDFAGQNLAGADVSSTYLAGADFTGAVLTGADLRWTELRGANFTDADLSGADLRNASLAGANFTRATLNGANLSGLDLRDTVLDGASATNLLGCPARLPTDWSCVDLGGTPGLTLLGPGASLSGLDLAGADLRFMNLDGVQITGLLGCPALLPAGWYCLDLGPAGLTLVGPGANLSGLDLSGASFSPATDLRDVSFEGSDLTSATFASATNFDGATFDRADLSGVNLATAQLDDVRATHLVNCPSALPADWNCLLLAHTGETLVGPGADLSGLNLSGANLDGQVLDGADLRNSDLSGASLVSADLTNARLDAADLGGANLTNAVLDGADLQDADLAAATLAGADLNGANLDTANLSGADLTNAVLEDASLDSANLSGADLSNALLDGASLDDADLSSAVLDGADVRSASLQDADLTGASLMAADLTDSDFGGAVLAGISAANLQGCPVNLPASWDCVAYDAGTKFVLVGPAAALGGLGLDLTGADLSGADLIDADLSGADLTNALIDGIDASGVDLSGTTLDGADLSGTDFSGANLTLASLVGADLADAELATANLAGVTATGLQTCPASLPSSWNCIADAFGNDLLIGPGADLGGINLDLSGANLSGYQLAGIDLTGADLSAADLSSTVLTNATLVNADLSNADLSSADLTGADLTGATLTGVTWSDTTCPSGVNSDSNGNTCP